MSVKPVDESIEMSEGVAVQVRPSDEVMTAEERAELDAAVEESAAQFARGECEEAVAFARCLEERARQ